ncbi:hypothetical protein [Hyphomicrobium sp. NDB2Meth4]|uniref:hypothetical protein n=1 Tax=Hyphomicrobium sp. NDB2Meth4 TaxID=1892846 RepID=UPI001114F23E|nr:hypothetical protein [Hyphomicrobium sp. NDB2Meth4]
MASVKKRYPKVRNLPQDRYSKSRERVYPAEAGMRYVEAFFQPWAFGLNGLEVILFSSALSEVIMIVWFGRRLLALRALPVPTRPEQIRGPGTIIPMWFGVMFVVFATLSYLLWLPVKISFIVIVALILPSAIVVALLITSSLLLYSVELNARFGKVWVKALDFPYLLFGAVGLLRIIDTSPVVAARHTSLDTIAITSVSLALAIRLAKSILEVFFDKWIGSTTPGSQVRSRALPK